MFHFCLDGQLRNSPVEEFIARLKAFVATNVPVEILKLVGADDKPRWASVPVEC